MFDELYNFKNTLSFVLLYCYIYVSWRGREGGRGKEGGRGGRERETLEDVHSLLEGSEAESEGGSGKERGSDREERS